MAYSPAQKRAYWAKKSAEKKKKDENKIPRPVKNWSKYQLDIFNELQYGSGNIIVNAAPGSSKTSSTVEALYRLPEDVRKKSIALAFNTDIKDELEARVPPGVQAKTFHSLCFGVLSKNFKGVQLEKIKGAKMDGITIALVGDDESKSDLREAISATAALAKSTLSETPEEIGNVIDQYDLDATDERDALIDYTQRALKVCAMQTSLINFEDMIWLVSKHNLECPKYPLVTVDEAQDSSKMRIDIIHRVMDANSRAAIFGDRRQALYSWAGADEHSMDNLQRSLNCKSFPLSISYRCAKSIVREAQKLEPSIEWSPDAPEGIVEDCGEDKMMLEARAGDFIISRVNAPLVKLCFQFLRVGQPANIQGRDVGRSLGWMVRRAKKDTIPAFLTWLRDWEFEEVDRLTKKDFDTTVIHDKAGCLKVLCENARSIKELMNNIKLMFVDNDKNGEGQIILTTAHRSKGKERDRVWLLEKTFKFPKSLAEDNVRYVSITRARNSLFYVR
jgi:DNA helicase II / ATP-dependent DNA helicase PcrA